MRRVSETTSSSCATMYLSHPHQAAIVGLVLASGACEATVPATRPSNRSRPALLHALTEQELERTGVRNAYEAVERLRAEWSRVDRAQSGGDDIAVYVDGIRTTDMLPLRGIPSWTIALIAWLTPQEATTRFGAGHSRGAIVIVTTPAR